VHEASMAKDLRDFLTELDKKGELIRIREPMEDGHEIFTILWELSQRKNSPAVILEKVKGYNIPIVSNIFGTMDRFALAAGFPEDKSYKFYRDL